MSEFLKIGPRIVNKPNGSDYELINGKIYDLKYDEYRGDMWLEENGTFNLPQKIYYDEIDKAFIERILTYFNATSKQTTGVLFNGVKGTGKTVMAKKLAIDSNLPVIIPSENFPSSLLLDYFKKIKTPVCILIDEIEKTRNTEKILTFLDGIESTCKKLVIMTSNDNGKLNENLFDRPSRVRYYREFVNNNSPFIKEIIADQGIVDTDDKIYNFIINGFATISIDNIMSLIEEIKIFGSDNLPELIKYINIVPSKTAPISEKTNINKKPNISEITFEDALELDSDEIMEKYISHGDPCGEVGEIGEPGDCAYINGEPI